MVQVALAPCSPFSVSRDLMRASAELARSYVALYRYLAEIDTVFPLAVRSQREAGFKGTR